MQYIEDVIVNLYSVFPFKLEISIFKKGVGIAIKSKETSGKLDI